MQLKTSTTITKSQETPHGYLMYLMTILHRLGKKLASKIPPAQKYYHEFLSKSKSPNRSFFFAPITPEEIKLEILSIPINKSHGLYSCPTQILKCLYNVITDILAQIFNISITSGTYPSKLKMAKITAIFKTEDETNPNNYRPISLFI